MAPFDGAHAWPPSTAKFRLSALAQYLRCRRVGRHRKLSSKLVVRLTIHGDKDRRLEVGPWSLDVVAYVVAVLLRRVWLPPTCGHRHAAANAGCARDRRTSCRRRA